MNKTLAITAFTMFAVIMGISAIAPAMAAPGGEKGANPEAPGQVEKVSKCERLQEIADKKVARGQEVPPGIAKQLENC